MDSVIDFRLALADSQIIALGNSQAPAVTAADPAERAIPASAFFDAARTEDISRRLRSPAGYNWSNTSLNINATRPGWLVQLGTAFPLFNGFVRENVDVEQAFDQHGRRTVDGVGHPTGSR